VDLRPKTLLLFGRLADIYGHRKLFNLSLVWFIAFSVAAGFAPNEVAMDIFRAMQGIGMGAAIVSPRLVRIETGC
jgi:MFS family permease